MPAVSHHVEVFVINSALCEQVILLIQRVAGHETKISVCDVRQENFAERAHILGLHSFPAVVIDGDVLPFDPFLAVSRMLATVNWTEVFKAS